MIRTKDQATKRPWYLSPADADDTETLEKCSGIFSNGYICPIVNNADAKLIVTAVNCHDELVEALTGLLNCVERNAEGYMLVNWATEITEAEQALTKAKGGQ